MSKKSQILIFLGLLVGMFLLLSKCGTDTQVVVEPPKTPINPPRITNPIKKPIKLPRIIIGEPKAPNPVDPPIWIPGTPFPGFEGEVDNDIHLIFQPGLGLMYSDQLRLDLDVQLVRWRNWGLLIGDGIAVKSNAKLNHELWIGPSYRLFKRTEDDGIEPSVYVGGTLKKRICGGFRIRF